MKNSNTLRIVPIAEQGQAWFGGTNLFRREVLEYSYIESLAYMSN